MGIHGSPSPPSLEAPAGEGGKETGRKSLSPIARGKRGDLLPRGIIDIQHTLTIQLLSVIRKNSGTGNRNVHPRNKEVKLPLGKTYFQMRRTWLVQLVLGTSQSTLISRSALIM